MSFNDIALYTLFLLIVVALTYLPAVALGPIIEQLRMINI